MAEARPIILSSPSAPQQHALIKPSSCVTFMSSSPSLPSPSELISKHFSSRARNGNNVPKGRLAGNFVKASSLIPIESANEKGLHSDSQTQHASKRSLGSTKFKTQSGDPVAVDYEAGTKPQTSSLIANDHAKNGLVSHEGSHDDAPLNQSTIRRKVVKKSTASNAKDALHENDLPDTGKKRLTGTSKKIRTKKAGMHSEAKAVRDVLKRESNHKRVESAENFGAVNEEARQDLLQLEAALKRRKCWTPPPEAEPLGSPMAHDGQERPTRGVETKFRDISSFQSDIGCDVGVAVQSLPTSCVDGIATKRRKVELVSAATCTPSITTKPQRAKSPKKKARTITGKATAPFMSEAIPESTDLTQYFSLLTPDSSDHTNKQPPAKESKAPTENENPANKAKAPRKSSAKAKKIAIKKQPTLLSPEDAVASANTQTVLFGTSSQLARDDSPTLIQDIRRAIAESEVVEEGTETVTEPRAELGITHVPRGAKSLWTAAARDPNNELHGEESFTSNKLDDVLDSVFLQNNPVSRDRQVTDEVQPPQGEISQLPEVPELEIQLGSLLLPKSLADASSKARRSSISPSKRSRKKAEISAEMPNYSGFTQAELGKEVSKFGFKPIRKREEMVALLQRCWESTHRAALQTTGPNKPLRGDSSKVEQSVGDNEVEEPKRRKARKREGILGSKPTSAMSRIDDITVQLKPRGRPRKKALDKQPTSTETESIPVQDITASHRASMSRKSAKTPAMRSEPTSPEGASKPMCQSDPEKLFAKVTEAVKAEPPTQDPNSLSFFEKILIYQPIVIEDLTTWLNTKGLITVGIDEEVASGLVKAWCEGRSVCCLWRENLRGGKRARR